MADIKIKATPEEIQQTLGSIGGPPPPALPPVPPPPPPPTPAVAGFSAWAADPQNQSKVAGHITAPNQPLMPPPPPPPPVPAFDASKRAPMAAPPQTPMMASTAPPSVAPGTISPLQPPTLSPDAANSLGGPAPALPNVPQSPLRPPTLQPDMQTQQQWASANPTQQAQQIGQGKIGKGLFLAAAGLTGAAGGMHGDPSAGLNYVAGVNQYNNSVPGLNQERYQDAVVKPYQQGIANQDQQAQAAERTAQATQQQAKAAAEQPQPLSAEVAKSIGKPELAGQNFTPAETRTLLMEHAKTQPPLTLQQMHAAAVQTSMQNGEDPSKDPKVNMLADQITGLQKQPAEKTQNKDDRYIAIMAKPPNQRTPEEQSFVQGYKQYVDLNKIQPAVARTQVQLMMPQEVADPNNPGGVIYTTRKDAIGKEAPNSIGVTTAKATAKDFTSGKDAQTLNSFNTATEHLAQLSQAATALGNGNLPALNAVGNAYAKATGAAAPTNFQAVKSAVAGEVGKVFKGGAATDAEIKEFNGAISAANSPAQLQGVIQTYTGLMNSKRQSLQQQYTAGMSGRPNFGGASSVRVGQQVKLKNGQTVTVKVVHPDGSFE